MGYPWAIAAIPPIDDEVHFVSLAALRAGGTDRMAAQPLRHLRPADLLEDLFLGQRLAHTPFWVEAQPLVDEVVV